MWCCSSLRVLRDDLGTMDDTSHGMGSRVRAERGLVGSAGVHNHVKSASCRGLCSHLFRLCHGCETISMFGHGQLAVFLQVAPSGSDLPVQRNKGRINLVSRGNEEASRRRATSREEQPPPSSPTRQHHRMTSLPVPSVFAMVRM